MKNDDFWADEAAQINAGEYSGGGAGENNLDERTRMNEISEKNKKETKVGTIAGIAAGGVTIAALCFFVGTQVSGNRNMSGGMGGPGGQGGPGMMNSQSQDGTSNTTNGNTQGGPGGQSNNQQGGPGGINSQNGSQTRGAGGQGGPQNNTSNTR